MEARKIAQFESLVEGRDGLKAIVYYDFDKYDYYVSFYRNDVYIKGQNYATADKDDALATASWFVSYETGD